MISLAAGGPIPFNQVACAERNHIAKARLAKGYGIKVEADPPWTPTVTDDTRAAVLVEGRLRLQTSTAELAAATAELTRYQGLATANGTRADRSRAQADVHLGKMRTAQKYTLAGLLTATAGLLPTLITGAVTDGNIPRAMLYVAGGLVTAGALVGIPAAVVMSSQSSKAQPLLRDAREAGVEQNWAQNVGGHYTRNVAACTQEKQQIEAELARIEASTKA